MKPLQDINRPDEQGKENEQRDYRRCGNCGNAEPIKAPIEIGVRAYECHGAPPSVVIVNVPDPISGRMQAMPAAMWPIVPAEGFCAAFCLCRSKLETAN